MKKERSSDERIVIGWMLGTMIFVALIMLVTTALNHFEVANNFWYVICGFFAYPLSKSITGGVAP